MTAGDRTLVTLSQLTLLVSS